MSHISRKRASIIKALKAEKASKRGGGRDRGSSKSKGDKWQKNRLEDKRIDLNYNNRVLISIF